MNFKEFEDDFSVNLDIKVFLPEIEYDIIMNASRILDKRGIKGYLVGGIVRDMVLGRLNIDVDIVVEKDGVAFARELSESLGGEITVYDSFLTSTIVYNDKTIDIASMRKETYAKSGALPDVSTGTLIEDVKRRDFSINGLYVSINSTSFGEVTDLCGGISDLSAGIVRVLHDVSFVDDPTRILRGIRFNARFGYNFDKGTAKLLRQAVLGDVFAQISKERLSAELQLILDEENVASAFLQLKKYDVLEALVPGIRFNKKVFMTVSTVADSLIMQSESNSSLNHRLAVVAALLVNTKELDIDMACQMFGLPNRVMEKVLKLCEYKAKIRKVVKDYSNGKKYSNYKLYCQIRDIPDEILLVLESFFENSDVSSIIRAYFDIRKNASIMVDGDDLLNKGIKPGPQYKEIFEYVLEKKLNGLAASKNEQMKAVEEFLQKTKLNKLI